MGMDVYGKAATTKDGEYFRNNVWWWRPLADYCLSVAPETTKPCHHWHSNDGDGLNAAHSEALAQVLQAEIDSGRCASYAAIREAELNAMQNETCHLCEGTGTRKAAPEVGAGDPKDGGISCNGCEASGSVRPYETMYGFSVENVQKFVVFLRACGGFSIC